MPCSSTSGRASTRALLDDVELAAVVARQRAHVDAEGVEVEGGGVAGVRVVGPLVRGRAARRRARRERRRRPSARRPWPTASGHALALHAVPPGDPRSDAAHDLVADRAEPLGPVVGGERRFPWRRSAPPRRRPPPASVGPQSTMSWSMVTTPTTGRRSPADEHLAADLAPAPGHAVGVADGHGGDDRVARRSGGAARS